MKILFLFSIILVIFSCRETTTNTVANNGQTLLANQPKMDSVPTNEVEFSKINWNNYLNKGDFEQVSSDSVLFIVVKLDYAFFIYAQQDSEDIYSYDMTAFQKQNNKWVKTINEQITDLTELQGNIEAKWLFEDINGDDAKDILLKVAHDGRQRKNYVCFLQDKIKKEFVKVEHFNQLDNPEYDKNKKVLNTHGSYHGGSTSEIYRWEGNVLKFIKGIEDSAEGEKEYFKKKW